MTPIIQNIIISFIKLAVAVDLPGVIPIYLTLVDEFHYEERKEVVKVGLVTSFVTGLLFLFLGKLILKIMGITIADFQIGGGLILVLIGIRDLIGEEKIIRKPSESIGIIPLGVPLVIGPAVISIMLLMVDQFGYIITLVSFVANMIITGIAFHYAAYLNKVFGRGGMKVTSKIIMMLLISLGVKMIRMGILPYVISNGQ